ncbi:MAG: hypothetical protein HY360_03715, partial [Verrucomicrobia bacterium]|nr:hypothetical protein [Verrucomicrobiota bacterium]
MSSRLLLMITILPAAVCLSADTVRLSANTTFGIGLQSNPKLIVEISEWTKEGFVPWAAEMRSHNGLEIQIQSRSVQALTEWALNAHNQGSAVRRIRLRWRMDAGVRGGDFWDGFGLSRNVVEERVPLGGRYAFPGTAYSAGDRTCLLGYAPQTISSRFARACRVEGGQVVLEWDSFLALHPGQKDAQVFLTALLPSARNYAEAVEQVYRAYPDFFRPIAGADPRIRGEGGYYYSSDAMRLYQLEEARRLGLNWEWCYAPFQKPGDIWPSAPFWDAEKGYSIERTQNDNTRPGSIADWRAHNLRRFEEGNKAAAMFYYYLPQYCETGILTNAFPDAVWRNPDGRPIGSIHGWIKSSIRSQYAWPGETGYGEKLRRDLAAIWSNFPIAGFAMDMTLGDTPYAGEALSRESGKAFDDQGRVFAVEGVAVAGLMKCAHRLPPHSDGRCAAIIANEPVTWLPIFHADAIMHEMPPYDRSDIVPARRLMAGQKPLCWWKGFRVEQILDWQRLSPAEFKDGLGGIVDYVVLASLRYGAIPPVFFVRGYPEVRAWIPRLRELQRAGWRAASYVKIEGPGDPDTAVPFAENASVWISRYGDEEDSHLVFSAPDAAGFQGRARIETSRFNAGGAVYLEVQEFQNRVGDGPAMAGGGTVRADSPGEGLGATFTVT